MKTTYFWPIYGERDEVCFTHSSVRSGQHVRDMLGLSPPDGALLLSDGYVAYASYAKQIGLAHAQCRAHARREVFEAKDVEPALAESALEHIALANSDSDRCPSLRCVNLYDSIHWLNDTRSFNAPAITEKIKNANIAQRTATAKPTKE